MPTSLHALSNLLLVYS